MSDKPETLYESFWKSIVETNGALDPVKVRAELFDYHTLMQSAAKVYAHITGGKIGKVNTDPDVVCTVADDEYAELYRLDLPCHEPAQEQPATCQATTIAGADKKFRVCELPEGHEGVHRAALGGLHWHWENRGAECQHGHLARVCPHCELIASEAEVARLSARVAELEASFLWLCEHSANLTRLANLAAPRLLNCPEFCVEYDATFPHTPEYWAGMDAAQTIYRGLSAPGKSGQVHDKP